MIKADLHIHSSYSDGSDSIEELAKKINSSDIDIVSLTDHDTVGGLSEFEKLLDKNKKFIKGIELTCLAEGIKCHILGYGINPKTDVLEELIAKGKILRRIKLETRIKYLEEKWDIDLTKEELDWLYSRNSVVKTHIANILVRRGLSDDNVTAMKKYLDGCKSPNTRFDGKEAIDVIKKSGGIPVWAHPLGGEGESHCSREELLSKLKTMTKLGIEGLECHYSRYNDSEIEFLIKTAKENKLLITGGSDYHGSNKDIPLLQLNSNGNYPNAKELTILKYV